MIAQEQINKLCEGHKLDKCQSTCKCGHSHISVYTLVDGNMQVKFIVGFCPKCNHEWVILAL